MDVKKKNFLNNNNKFKKFIINNQKKVFIINLKNNFINKSFDKINSYLNFFKFINNKFNIKLLNKNKINFKFKILKKLFNIKYNKY